MMTYRIAPEEEEFKMINTFTNVDENLRNDGVNLRNYTTDRRANAVQM